MADADRPSGPPGPPGPPGPAGSENDDKLVTSWHRNAAPWTAVVREGRLESRVLVTNAAIVDAVMSRAPRTALDVGCGEGWLSRALAERGVDVTGVDVVPELIERSQRAWESSAGAPGARGRASFRVLSHEEIGAGALDMRFDAVVVNFALLGKESVEGVIRRVPDLLTPRGSLFIQTLHPVVATGDQPYEDGWRAGTWTITDAGFTDPPPWYFRTLQSWIALLHGSGLRLEEMLEPVLPTTGKPASVIFIASATR